MSRNHSHPPSEGTPAGAGAAPLPGGVDRTREQLAAQALAANDQALQLAKLAEESARLARHLNEQLAARSGIPLPPPHPTSPPATETAAAAEITPAATPSNAHGPTVPLVVDAEPPPWLIARRSSRRGPRRGRGREIRERLRRDGVRGAATDGLSAFQILTDSRTSGRATAPVRATVRNWKSVLLSTTLHGLLLFLLGWLSVTVRSEMPIDTVLASFADERADEDQAVIEQPVDEPEEPQAAPRPEDPSREPDPPMEPLPEPPPQPMPQQEQVAAAPPAMVRAAEPAAGRPAVDLAQVGSRSEEGKALLLKKYGGTAASESAVSRALDWFVSVQRRDGSWNFNDVGRASHAGDVNNPMGATSYVLLSFLGTGETHRQGRYRSNVARGLSFLLNNARIVGAGADFRGPGAESHHNFYVQGAAALALCEAYQMTGDRKLRIPAQGAIDFIVAAQDPRDGGWRYEPREPGCTSVTTLQLLALVGAQRAGLKVPLKTLDGVRHFYTTVKCDDAPNGRYAYRAAEPSYKSASSAQAALGRMYLGAPQDDEDLQAAVALLDDRGPYDNRYFCYYSTQVLKNWGGAEWDRWNESLREELIRTQAIEEGPEFGSWTPLQRGSTDVAGGRLFITALSAMTLEVYYRYLPVYDSKAQAATAQARNIAADGKPLADNSPP